MSGSALILPGAVTTSPFGKFHAIEGTWDSTVALIDFGLSPLGGVPVEGATLTNLMRERAAEVSGLGAAQCDFTVTNTIGTGTNAAAEITGKGGLHVASTQAGAQTVAAGIGISLGADFATWLLSQTDAGADYALLMSLFMRCTRDNIATSAQQSVAHIVASGSATTNCLLYSGAGTGNYQPLSTSAGYLVGRAAPPTAGNAGLAWNTSQGWLGTKPANISPAGCRRLAMLGVGDAWASFNYNKGGSYILYRAQLDLIDLSDIGGTDRAAKATAMIADLQSLSDWEFGSSGRFADDTFTPAATLKA